MRRLALPVCLVALLCGSCAAVAPQAFPQALRGTWATTSAACANPQVRVTSTTLVAFGSVCRLRRASSAANGDLLVRMDCARPGGGGTDELVRLSRRAEWLRMQAGGAQLAWRRCG